MVQKYKDEDQRFLALFEFAITTNSDYGGGVARPDAQMSVFLLETQDKFGVKGNLTEIGVKEGRFLVIMAHYLRSDEFLYAIDPQYELPEIKNFHVDAVREFSEASDRLVSIFESSLDLKAEDLMGENGKKSRFIHIDGNHTEDFVYQDLLLAESILVPGGILAVDDYFDFSGVGVSAALFKFMSERKDTIIRPVMCCQNKFFLTTVGFEEQYCRNFMKLFSRDEAVIFETSWMGMPVLSSNLQRHIPKKMLEKYPDWPNGTGL